MRQQENNPSTCRFSLGPFYDNEGAWQQRSEEEAGQFMQDYYTYTAELAQSDKMISGEPLQPTVTATSVRVRNRQTLTMDGPFAETKEQFGDYYLIEADDPDEAIEWARKIPSSAYGTIEVRPVMEMQYQPE